MILVGKEHPARRHAAHLERRVIHHPLRQGHAVIERAVQHQRGGLHVPGEGRGILRGHLGRIAPVLGAQFVVKPVPGVAGMHRRPVVAAGVAHIGLVAVATLFCAIAPVHPRHHVAAVTAARGRHARRVDEAALEQVVGAGFDVGMLLEAELRHVRLHELAAPAEGAVVVHAGDDIALRGKQVVVPAEMEVVAPARVRAAVDVVHQRPLFLRVEIRRIDHPHLHGFAVPALDRHVFHASERDACHRLLVEGFDRTRVAAIGIGAPHGRRRGHVVGHIRQSAAPQVEFGDRPAGNHLLRRLLAARQPPDAEPRVFVRGEIDGPTVGRPAQRRIDVAVPSAPARHAARCAVEQRDLAVIHVRAPQVGHQQRDRPAIWRIGRVRVAQRRPRRQHFRLAALEVDFDDLGGLVAPAVLVGVERERKVAPVGRQVEVRRARIKHGQFVARLCEQVVAFAAGHVNHMHARHPPVGQEMVPVLELGLFGDQRLDLVVLAIPVSLRLVFFAFQIRPHPGNEGDPPAVGKPFHGGGAGGQRGDAPRFAAVGRDHINLRLPVGVLAFATLGHERDERPVRRPLRLPVLLPAGGQFARLAAQVGQQPELGAGLVFAHVESGQRDAGLRAIRRQRGRGWAFELPQVLDRETFVLGCHGSKSGLRRGILHWPPGGFP